MPNWSLMTLKLRKHFGSERKLALELGCHRRTISGLINGATVEPKYSTGALIIKLHKEHCE